MDAVLVTILSQQNAVSMAATRIVAGGEDHDVLEDSLAS
jgi:hypothetical protein